MSERSKKFNYWTLGMILPITILAAWFIVAESGSVSFLMLPPIGDVINRALEHIASGQLFNDIGVSTLRVLKGYFLALIFGVVLGVVMGVNSKANRFFMVTFTAIRQVPMLAWIPLLIMWFGIGETSKIIVIFLAAYFPILVNTINGVEQTDQKLIEVGKIYQLSRWKIFKDIYLPSALPHIFAGMKIGVSSAWMALVGAEMIAAVSGIGFRLNDARSLLDSSTLFVGIISIAVVGFVMDYIIQLIAKRAMPWARV